MKPSGEQRDSRMVESPKRRKRHRSPSDRAREAGRLVERIEATTDDRHLNWVEGDQPLRTERLTGDLDHLHADKRQMRRDLYREAPQLEGRPVNRHPSKRLGA